MEFINTVSKIIKTATGTMLNCPAFHIVFHMHHVDIFKLKLQQIQSLHDERIQLMMNDDKNWSCKASIHVWSATLVLKQYNIKMY